MRTQALLKNMSSLPLADRFCLVEYKASIKTTKQANS